ncbi:MAG: ribonuclease P protein component [Leeuwenhoekiella sp.]
MNQKFPKAEKLKSQKRIDLLFKEGDRVKAYPWLLMYHQEPAGDVAIQAGVSVPKRNHKLAVTRNRIKRLMREVYRKNKSAFHTNGTSYSFMFIYTGREVMAYAEMEKSFDKLIKRFNDGVTRNK